MASSPGERARPLIGPAASSRVGNHAFRLLGLLLLLAFLVRIPFLPLLGHGYDVDLFRQWTATIYRRGLSNVFTATEIDYVGYTYVLWFIARVYGPFAPSPSLYRDKLLMRIVKLPGICGDLLVIALLFWVMRRLLQKHPQLITKRIEAFLLWLPLPYGRWLGIPERAGILVAAIYAFNPAVIYDSAYWGQVDSLITLFMLGVVAALIEGRALLSWGLLAVGFLIKPQPIILLPLLALVTLGRWGVRGVLKGITAAIATFVAGLAYFLAHGQLSNIIDIYDTLFRASQRVSFGAWNVWWPAEQLRQAKPQDELFTLGSLSFSYEDIARLLVIYALAPFLLALRRQRQPQALFLAGSYLVFSFFMLPVAIHERYLYPLLALLAPMAVLEKRWAVLYAALSVTLFLNLFAIQPIYKDLGRLMLKTPFSLSIMSVNIALFLTYSAFLLIPQRLHRQARSEAPAESEAV